MDMQQQTICSFVDFEKAFEWENTDLLVYKLFQNSIDGNMFHAIKAIQTGITDAVTVNNVMKDWFSCT